MGKRKGRFRNTRERGHGKHRTVGAGDEEPWFKKRVTKNRVRGKQQKRSRKANRRK